MKSDEGKKQGGEAVAAEAPLLTHDRSLHAKVARGSEAGDILDQQMLMLAGQLVTQLNVLLKTARTHGRANVALEKPIDSILAIVRALGNDQPVVLRLQNDFLFLGDAHLRTTVQQMPVFTSVVDVFGAMGLGGISFAPQIAAGDLRELAMAILATAPGEEALGGLRERLSAGGVSAITLLEPRRVGLSDEAGEAGRTGAAAQSAEAGEGPTRARQRARSGYARAAASLSTLNQSVREGGAVSFRQAKRVIQGIVDFLLRDPATMLGLTTLRSHDEYTHNHSVNVALLSMALGNRAGYKKPELADLGLAALLHDIGKCAIALDVLNKPAELNPGEWELMRTHPSEGVVTLTRLRGIANIPSRMAASSFEHHLRYDIQGYPKLTVPWRQSIVSRIVSIADVYDAMTSARVYRREPLSSPIALQYMLGRAGSMLDPVLLKLFVTCVGIVPIGTMVLLDGGELAVVTAPAPDPALADRPPVRVIALPDGTPIEDSPQVDLREKNAEGAYLRSIERLVDNTKHHLDTSRWVAV